jgi:hypothetical protein
MYTIRPIDTSLLLSTILNLSPQKGRRLEMANIKWESEMQAALKRAKSENKPVLLDFFNPG